MLIHYMKMSMVSLGCDKNTVDSEMMLGLMNEKGFENLVISRLARGLPVGVDLEYADQITLSHALEGRKAI